jgi:hypothetical protein
MQNKSTNYGAVVNHSNFDDIVIPCIQGGLAVHIWGPPAVGKSARVYALADLIDHDVIEVRLAQMDALDSRGIPFKGEDGMTHYAAPSWLPAADCGPTILFFDEWSQAHPTVQNPMSQLVFERVLGDYQLPDNVVVVLASNRASDRAGANKMMSNIASRLVHVELVPEVAQWIDWARDNDLDQRVVDFVNFRRDYFYKFDPKSTEMAYPCLRSWEMLSKAISNTSDINVVHAIALGLVGQEAGHEFRIFCECLNDLPSIDAIIADPDSVEVPQKIDMQFAVSAALSRAADATNVDNVWKFVSRLNREYSSIWLSDTSKRSDFNLSECPVFHSIANAHKNNLAA